MQTAENRALQYKKIIIIIEIQSNWKIFILKNFFKTNSFVKRIQLKKKNTHNIGKKMALYQKNKKKPKEYLRPKKLAYKQFIHLKAQSN